MPNMFDLRGKTAMVTGASRGLGAAMAEALMESGVKAVLFATSNKILTIADEYTKKGYTCYGLVVDLSLEEERKIAFEKGLNLLDNRLDILVNCAGVQRRHKSEEFPLDDWNYVIEVNLTAVFRMCQMAGKVMLKQGKGKIINVASMLSFFGGLTVPAYAASKGGVAQLTKALCNEWAGSGINVNALAPGYMATEMNTALMDPSNPRYKTITDRIPAHRWGTPEDMKGPVIFLASSASDYLNGAIIPVDGGYLAC
ncbi:SDR family NAD(P)-dependent oxidoreductase [Acetomicrobium mobile]|jgi:2-deoxy-D-gluconate 3-dehydrogenase|uniref:SDR family NAD(P)-dependent oxidoreductase n=1 Tax=Acetomicrobium mobile TaxID=97477 RepID=UPI0026EF7CF3|nr:SDR family NAD(P)-dependent oxidoreductase [Acetomicrobium mobile]